ncbi:MAG: Ig-like domain-containing protein [Oscillospiraceae bacterium]
MKKLHAALALCLAAALCLGAATVAGAENSAPVAENLEITTYRGVSVGGRLAAVDPEGEIVTFEITTPPIKGTLELGENGEFTYTPNDGKKGKDYFGYKAIDSDGNASHEATVIIRIEKQKCKVTYSDMAGNSAAYAAIRLAEEEIFVGECLGGEYVLNPEQEVTRGEFLAMCMKLGDIDLLSGVQRTGFSDDGDIPQWMRPYVSTALMCGAITGVSTDEGIAFNPSRAITGAEAMVMLNNILNLTNVSYGTCDEEIPGWASQAVINLSAHRIIDSADASEPTLTRAEAAEMLCRALDM